MIRAGVSAALLLSAAGALCASLAGCTGSSSGDPSPTAGASASSAATGGPRPGEPPTAEQLARAAEAYPGVDPPEVTVVRVVSAADLPQTQVDCLGAQGFDAQLTSDGQGVQYEVGEDQVDAVNLASYICWLQYPVDPAQTGENLTDEQKLIVYTYLTKTLVDCLAENGYTTTDIPSKETFLGAENIHSWNPYNRLTSLGESDYNRLASACPPNTPPQLLYGE